MAAINGQHESKESFYHLEICCRLVGEKYGRPAIAEWTNGDYIKLSSILSHKTGTQISPNTLKRIFGKLKTPERYYPQKATRDALARYAGFDDWEKFQLLHPRPARLEEKESVKQSQSDSSLQTAPALQSPKKNSRKWWWLVLPLPGILAVVIWWRQSRPVVPNDIAPGDAVFTCNNPEGGNPHSAVFKLTLAENFTGNTDGFTISFGDGKTPRKILPGVLLTHYYEIPGRYFARLLYNEKAIDTTTIYLRSNGWTATATMDRDTIRVYPVTNGSLFSNHHMTVDTRQLYHAGIDTNKTFYVDFVNTRPTDIDGDNFELTAQVITSSPRAGVRCSQVNATVYGTHAIHDFRVIKPGCTTFTNLQFSEIYKAGAADDLSMLGIDLTHGGSIALRVINKRAKVLVNGKEVYSIGYQQPLGKISGIRIGFAGIGTINNVQLKDLTTGEVFNDGFQYPQ